MQRGYRHIREYEKEMLELKEQGKTLREIGERPGFSRKHVHDFISRHNEQQRKNSRRNSGFHLPFTCGENLPSYRWYFRG